MFQVFESGGGERVNDSVACVRLGCQGETIFHALKSSRVYSICFGHFLIQHFRAYFIGVTTPRKGLNG